MELEAAQEGVIELEAAHEGRIELEVAQGGNGWGRRWGWN